MIPQICDEHQNYISHLHDCISCKVTEERNGVYECELEYSVASDEYSLITIGRYILCPHDSTGTTEYFRIYSASTDINGSTIFSACHESYDLGNIIVKPFKEQAVTGALIHAKSLCSNPFTFSFFSTPTMTIEKPTAIKDILQGSSGSILDTVGSGDYKYIGKTVQLVADRGQDRGVTIAYGINMASLGWDIDAGGDHNACFPYYASGGMIVVGCGQVIGSDLPVSIEDAEFDGDDSEPIQYCDCKIVSSVMDCSGAFETVPTSEQLRAYAQKRLDSEKPWISTESLDLDVAELSDRIFLCDTVTILHGKIGLSRKAKVTTLVWDVLSDKLDSIGLGDIGRSSEVR